MATARMVNRGEDQFVLLTEGHLVDCDEVEMRPIDGGIILSPIPRDPSHPPSPDPEDAAIRRWLGALTA